MTYRERMTWATLLPSAAFLLYLLLGLLRDRAGSPGMNFRFTLALICFTFLQAVISGAVSLLSRRKSADERDRLVSLLSFKSAYWVLFWAALLWICFLYQGREPVPGSVGFGLVVILFAVEVLRSSMMLILGRTALRV